MGCRQVCCHGGIFLDKGGHHLTYNTLRVTMYANLSSIHILGQLKVGKEGIIFSLVIESSECGIDDIFNFDPIRHGQDTTNIASLLIDRPMDMQIGIAWLKKLSFGRVCSTNGVVVFVSSSVAKGVNSDMKFMTTCLFSTSLGLNQTSNSPSSIAHLTNPPDVSGFWKTCRSGWLVKMMMVCA